MQTRKRFMIAGCLTVLGLLLASCAPGVAPTPTAKPTAAPSRVETPATKPAVAPAAPSPTTRPTVELPRAGGILNISHFADPGSLDPIQESSVQAVALVMPCYSGIVQHDPLEPTKVIGDIAESWDMSPDGLSYTFRFFKNIKWHDGAPFTSEDARFTLEMVRKPLKGIISPRQEWLKAADKIETAGKDMLRITLQYSSASFLHNLGDGRMGIVPKHIYEAKGSVKKDVVGTGPYKFKSFTPGTSFSVVKNSDYFIKERPYLDGITWYTIPDVATRFAALRTHRVQVTPFGSQGLTPSQSEIIRKEMSGKIVVHKYTGLSFNAFWMPHNKAPWNDIRVRRAVELVIDRPNVVRVAVEGAGDISGYMPPGAWNLPGAELLNMPGYRQNKEADIAEAKQLIADSGHAQGIKTTTIARNVSHHERGAISMKEQLAQIGIDITVSIKDAPTVNDLGFKRAFDTAVFSGTASYDDPDQVFGQQFVSGVPRNFSDFNDEKVDKWYDEQSRAMDPAKRRQIVLDMQRRLHELIPCSMVYWLVYELGQWVEVKDFKTAAGVYNNLKWQNVWLAQ